MRGVYVQLQIGAQALNVGLTAAVSAGNSGRANPKGESEDGENINTAEAEGLIWKRLYPSLRYLYRIFLVRFFLEVVTTVKDLFILMRAARKFKPDIVFLQTLLYPCYLSYFLPRSLPIVVTFWNGDVLWWAKWNGIERLLKKWIVTYGARRAQAVTVNSEAAYQACRSYGIGEERIHLIRYPGVDLERFRPLGKSDARSRLSIMHKNVVLAPRGLGAYLNSEMIVEAAALVLRECPDVLFLCLWNEDQRAELDKHRRRTKDLGIEDNFRWDYHVAWDRMPGYYSAADVMVSLSSNDSLPNCMLESMACGVPVIMGEIPVIREWVEDGVNGYLVGLGDYGAIAEAIVKVIRDKDGLNDQFVQNGLELVRSKADGRKNAGLVKELVRKIALRTDSSGKSCP